MMSNHTCITGYSNLFTIQPRIQEAHITKELAGQNIRRYIEISRHLKEFISWIFSD